ncbi:MAG: CHAD domain-containing protein [Blastocatellia bacterium]|nr:CHAD domain-containing protein [Blastocatellia bacterium]
MVESKMALEIETPPEAPEEIKQEESKKGPPPTLGEIVLGQLKTLREYHTAVMESGDVESVHKMRVTTRRLQASLDLLLMKDDEIGVRSLKKRLRRWRRWLSTVRNYDVFLIIINKQSSSRRPSQAPKFELLKTLLEERRRLRMEKVRRKLEQIDIAGIAESLGLSLDEPEPESEGDASTVIEADDSTVIEETTTPRPAGASFPGMDKKRIALRSATRLEQRLSEFLSLAADSHPTADPVELHELRIAAKRVRYILEIVSEIGYGDASRGLNWLRVLQDKIGDWHDLESLEEEIIDIVSRRGFIKANLSEGSRILQEAAHLRKKKDALVARLFPVRVPKNVAATSERLARALRRDGMREGGQNAASNEPSV